MAKFLETQAISNELLKIIKDAKEKIILISPYLQVNNHIQERLKTKGRQGTLSEIVIVYGKSELKETELNWLKDVPDLKLFEKNNLHAKVYLNEDKAIICSMNLYEYSQQTNIEMGILISKEYDAEAYSDLMEEINNIKVNGERKQLNLPELNLQKQQVKNEIENKANDSLKTTRTEKIAIELTVQQKFKFHLLKKWRLSKSKSEQVSAFHILTDEEIRKIVSNSKLDKNAIYEIVPKKNAIKYGDEILDELERSSKFTIGKVTNIWYQDNVGKYDKIKLKIENTGEEKWFDTTQELPTKDRIVAAKLNNTWFNEYIYIDN